ncbi:MAG: hypothetical protein NXI20_15125 [bacterium]|nr:hypothetical protein [bacterium]
MKLIIWYNIEFGKYEFGSDEDFRSVNDKYETIMAQQTIHLTELQVSRLTDKLNENLTITKYENAA